MSYRIARRLAICLGLILTVPIGTWADSPEGSRVPMVLRAKVKTPTRDGVVLRADVYLPSENGKFPAILLRTPYSAALGELSEDKTVNVVCRKFAEEFVASGFAFVIQDCRGTGRSDGRWEPYLNERKDGIDLQKWVSRQGWCDGKIGLFGGSYCGYTQWAVASHGGDGLRAMCNDAPLFDWYDVQFTHGAFRLDPNVVWNTLMARPKASQLPLAGPALGGWQNGIILTNGKSWDTVLAHLPIRTVEKQVGGSVPWHVPNVSHPEFDEHWRPTTTTDQLVKVVAPNLTFSGWYDLFVGDALRNLPKVRQGAENEAVRQHQHLIIGPWGHKMGQPVGEIQFGDQADLDLVEFRADWYEHWLTNKDTGVGDWPFLKIFVMGENRWRDEHEWPLKRTTYRNYYFHGNGLANTRSGDGRLTENTPASERPDRYRYDPRNPVPSHGGFWRFLTPCGPYEQESVEKREDVLVYTSEEVTEPLEVTGPIKVVLYAASNALDTDWTAKLVDVHPDGRAYNLCEGIQRARYRTPGAPATLLEPGKPYRYEIDLWATSNVFLPRHRIRVQVSSSNFPCFDRNPNTGHAIGEDAEVREAEQMVYHTTEYPSHIVLPVIPR